MKLKNKYLSKVTRKYIKKIKNKDLKELQSSVYARYINIEQIRKKRFKNVQNLEVLQRQLENARQGFFKETSTVKSVAYFSEELLEFSKSVDYLINSDSTRLNIKKLYSVLVEKIELDNVIMHIVSILLIKVNEMNLTTFKNQMKITFVKQLKSLENVEINDSELFHFIDIIISSLEISKVILLTEQTRIRYNKPFTEKAVSLSPSFIGKAVAYDLKNSNMPMFSLPKNWCLIKSDNDKSLQIGGGGFLLSVEKDNVVSFNREKSYKTVGDQTVIDNLNYLQSVPYKINRKRLKEITDDFDGFLSSQNFNIHLYKDLDGYLNENQPERSYKTYSDQR